MADEKVSVLIDVKVESDAALKRQQELKGALEATKASLIEIGKTQGKTSEEYIKAEAQVATLNQQLRNNGTVLKQIASDSSNVSGAYAALNQKAAESKQIAKDLAIAYGLQDERTIAAVKTANQYTDQLKETDNELGQGTRDVGLYGKAFESADGATKGALSSAKAFIANPIGIVIAAIAGAVLLLSKAFSRNEENAKKLNTVTGALSGIFNQLLKVLEPIAVFLADKLVKGFEIAGKAIDATLNLVSKGLKMVGLKDAAKDLDNFTNGMKEGAKQGTELANAEFELAKQVRESRKIQLEYQRLAEKQRQIRDDESKSISERIEANKQLGIILKKQSADELSIANESVKVAKMKIALNGATTASLDELAAKETEVIDIKERITGQESEQLVNLNSLRRDAVSKQKENIKARETAEKEASKAELDRLKKQSDDAIKTLEDTFALEQLKIQENNAKKEQTDAEYHATKLAEIESQNTLEIDKNKQLLDNKQITQAEYDNAIILANQQKNTAIAQENQAFNEEQKQKKIESDAIDFQNQYDTALLNNENMFALEKKALDNKKAAELEAAKTSNADVNLINQKYTALNIELKKKELDANLNAASQFAGNIASIFGKNTKVGKAAASAQIAIDTYKGAMAAFASMQSLPLGLGIPAGIAAAAAVAIQGGKAIKDVWAVKSGLPNDGGGGGGASVAGAVPTASVPASITGGLVSRQSGQVQQQAQTMAVDTALKANPTQPVLVVQDVTTALNQQVRLKSDNSL